MVRIVKHAHSLVYTLPTKGCTKLPAVVKLLALYSSSMPPLVLRSVRDVTYVHTVTHALHENWTGAFVGRVVTPIAAVLPAATGVTI